MIVCPQVGRIADFDRLTQGTALYKYGLVNSYDSEGNGSHTWLFGHVFDKSNQFYDEFNHSIVLKRCEDDNDNKWGLLLDLGDGNQYAYGQIAGASLKVNNQTYTTIDVVNTVNPFLPLGNSGPPNSTYPVHLHLNTLPFNTEISSDLINGDPCQFLDIDRPSYDVTVNSQFNPNGISLTYPGTSPTKIKARVQMHGEPVNVNRYSHLMDADKVELLLKKDIESEYKRIKGDNKTAIVSEGGRLGEAVINHSNPENKTNWLSQGVNSNAYNSATSGANARNPWDDYYFIDFPTRIHKNDQLNSGSLYSDTPENARYNDGIYDFKVRVSSANGSYEDDGEKELIIDNFQPFLSKISLQATDGIIYESNRSQFEGNSNIKNDSYVIPLSGNGDYIIHPYIEIHSSEPLENLSCQFRINDNGTIGQWQTLTTYYYFYNNEKIWRTFRLYPSNFNHQLCHEFKFEGRDFSGNSLMNIYRMSNGNQNEEVSIPVRLSPNQWGNLDNDYQNGADYIYICPDELCNGEPNQILIGDAQNIYNPCDDLNNWQQKIERNCEASSYILKLFKLGDNTTLPLFQWFKDGQLLEGENDLELEIFEAGNYFYSISYDSDDSPFGPICCQINGVFSIPEMSFNIEFPINYEIAQGAIGSTYNLNLKFESTDIILAYPLKIELLNKTQNQYFPILTILEYGTIGPFTNLISGCNYCLKITDNNGCIEEKCFYIEGNSCNNNYIDIQGVVQNSTCNSNSGSISIITDIHSLNNCNNIRLSWNNPQHSDGHFISNLAPGTYCVTAKFEDIECSFCSSSKCFTVQSNSGTNPIDVNAITRIQCVEQYNEKTGNYTIKWFGFVDMKVSGGTGNYTFKWYPQPINSSNNQNGGVDSYRFQFDQNGPYCVEITDDCGNIYQNCFDDAPIVRESTDGISLEVAEKFGCLGVDREFAEGFYRTFGFSDPKFNIVDLMTLLPQRNYPVSFVYNPGLVFVKDYFSEDSVSYIMLVDNKFIMGNVGLRIRSGMPIISSVENINTDTSLIDRGVVFKAYPNPFSDQLNVSIFSKGKIEGVLEVHSIMGQRIYSENIEIRENTTTNKTLPLNRLSSGVYTISFVSDDKNQNIKVVKVR
jgi:hypothetical protein